MANPLSRLVSSFNIFRKREATEEPHYAEAESYISMYGGRPDRIRVAVTNERSIIMAIFVRIAIDVASTSFRHVRLDEQDRYLEDIQSGLNNCLTLEANLDQSARSFIQDIAMTTCDTGVLAVVPVDTSLDPNQTSSFDILTMRVGTIVKWYPEHVKVSLYNEKKMRREDVVVRKRNVAIIENPLYSVMNDHNSTLQRLIRKLNLLDQVDELVASGKLDLIIQLPYVIKSEARRNQAEQRRKDIEFQLKGSQYGIAYTDGTEKITQLNRPAENNFLVQVEYLTKQLHTQLGITPAVMEGTASEAEMLNYWNRTIKPIVDTITGEFKRKFLTKTARTQKQSIEAFRQPFAFVTVEKLAEIADVFLRNEVTSSNEIRQIIGFKPSQDPKADELRNSNMPQPEDGSINPTTPEVDYESETADVANEAFDSIDSELDNIFKDLGVDENEIE